ncbi:MAG: hypothetical protein Q4A01_04265 [Coriobacteriales bacterium]|nr:hypothetical protein [Coriobacteriales bacterium]
MRNDTTTITDAGSRERGSGATRQTQEELERLEHVIAWLERKCADVAAAMGRVERLRDEDVGAFDDDGDSTSAEETGLYYEDVGPDGERYLAPVMRHVDPAAQEEVDGILGPGFCMESPEGLAWGLHEWLVGTLEDARRDAGRLEEALGVDLTLEEVGAYPWPDDAWPSGPGGGDDMTDEAHAKPNEGLTDEQAVSDALCRAPEGWTENDLWDDLEEMGPGDVWRAYGRHFAEWCYGI